MNTLEIKKEILRIVNELPESSLIQLLDLLKELQKYPAEDISSVIQIKQIIAEKKLLQKLTQ